MKPSLCIALCATIANALSVSPVGCASARLRAPTPNLQFREGGARGGHEYSAAARAAARAARAAAVAEGRPDGIATHEGELLWDNTEVRIPAHQRASAEVRASANQPAMALAKSAVPEQRRRLRGEVEQASELDAESVASVLTEFVESDYARRLCDTCGVGGTDYGQLGGMFESVRLRGTGIELRLKRSFEQKSVSLLDRLTKHLRQRMPQCERLQYIQGTTTRTICL